MKSGTKIIVLTPGFSADEMDTTTVPSLQMYFRNLKAYYPDIDLKIITFHYPARSEVYYWQDFRVIPAGGRHKRGGRIFLWLRVLYQLFRIKKESGIELIHSFWLGDTALVGYIFKALTGVPLLITAMGQDVKKENKYLRILRLFHLNLIFISQFQAEFNPGLVQNGRDNVIPFGIDPLYFSQNNSIRNIDILGVGSLNKIKNYKDFIEIISILRKKIPQLKCRIIGEGTERAEIDKNIIEMGLGNIIKLEGAVTYSNVITEMHSSKILLHTSHFEGQGLVITEALASGAYVVCYPTGIAKGLSCKKLFTGSTLAELSSHLEDILNYKKPDYSPEYIFSIADTCKKYVDVYNKLTSGKYYDS